MTNRQVLRKRFLSVEGIAAMASNSEMVRPKRPPPTIFDDSDKAVGRRGRLVRKAYTLTGQQLADILDITISSVSKIENGERRLDPRHASKLLLLYGVDHTWLYCGYTSGLAETTLKRLEDAGRTSSSASAASSRSA